ncbi:MAG: hypothetical protein Q9191_004234 [Dirinaria sp. TL-2023a]
MAFPSRGAGNSKGRTSWSGKPESYDYISFIGLFVYYLDALQQLESNNDATHFPDTPLQPIPTGVPLNDNATSPNPNMKLILGGYSYGSIIASHLPPIEIILRHFALVSKGALEAEVKIRASCLARERKKDVQIENDLHESDQSSYAATVAMGGDESDPYSRKMSRGPRRSMDTIRRSFDRSRRHLVHKSSNGGIHSPSEESIASHPLQAPEICYLLISTVLPPMSRLAMLFGNFGNSASSNNLYHHLTPEDIITKLSNLATLVVYGSKDIFTSHKKMRSWCEAVKARSQSRFSFHEVLNAGHFWREDGAETELRSTIRDWVEHILAS